MLEEVERESRGSTASRNRWKEPKLEAHNLHLPAIEVQQRIVDLVAAIDDSITALEEEARAAADVRIPLIDRMLAGDWRTERLGAIGTFERGKRFTKADYVSSGIGCIHYGQIYTEFGALASAALTFLPEELRPGLRFARKGDLVVAGTSENVADVGKAVAWLGDDDVAVHDDAYIYRHAFEPEFAPYLFASSVVQNQKVTTESKVVRISKANLEKIEVPIPDTNVQRQMHKAVSTLDESIESINSDLQKLRDLRSIVVEGMLTQKIELAQL